MCEAPLSNTAVTVAILYVENTRGRNYVFFFFLLFAILDGMRAVASRKQVRSEGVAVSHLKTGGFVGSMAFNRFMKTSSSPGKGDDGGYDYHDGGMFRRAWESFLHVVRKEGSVVGEVTKSIVGDKKRKRQDTSGLERSVNTVSATCDVSDLVYKLTLVTA